MSADWSIDGRAEVLAIRNRIREVVEYMKFELCPGKELIELTLGDPTCCGILPPHPDVLKAVSDSVLSGLHNGYKMSKGSEEARQALADKYSSPGSVLSPDDVYLTHGCSGAIQFAFQALLSPGQNVLTPRPGFSVYNTMCSSLQIENRLYRLDPARTYEADLTDLESKIDSNTGAIVVNNPSNPCGSVYSHQHLMDILTLAEKYRLPIIADEVYGNMTYSGNKFYQLGSISESVPVLSCSSLAKIWLVPGWRLGWLVIHNKKGILRQSVYDSFNKLSTLTLGPCSLIQGALPKILSVPQSWHDDVTRHIECTALTCYNSLQKAPGLTPIKPQGAMYIMIEIDFSKFPDIPNISEFVQLLCKETSVKLMPGSCFETNTAIRIVTVDKKEKMQEACDRICEFCSNHFKP
ncbi:tyrosine aminotransferase [Oopsacas minuta]|uniref:Tyrosine aminotransferase n=1 Tax=Oopsacas minuta TaxID=111878 RepID=A0AAV7KJ85_9METZ|nr:tyrosine aminotransferase [Oopsacas minuta]